MAVRDLPYKNIAGLTPCPGGWLVLPARLAGVTLSCEGAFVVEQLIDVLDYRPQFTAGAINAPIGLNDQPGNPYRPCDAEARDYVGWPRRVGVAGVVSRLGIYAGSTSATREAEPWMTRHDERRLRWLRETEREIQPFHTRTWFSAHPDVSFTAMNSDRPLRSSPYHDDGQIERLDLIESQMPGVAEVIRRTAPTGAALVHVIAAGALLWTARRVAAHAISRMPLDPYWDSAGLRTELVR